MVEIRMSLTSPKIHTIFRRHGRMADRFDVRPTHENPDTLIIEGFHGSLRNVQFVSREWFAPH